VTDEDLDAQADEPIDAPVEDFVFLEETGDRGEEHPGLPTPGGFILSFLGIAAAGLLGGAIGFGIENVNSRGDGGALLALAALVGSVVAALGTAVVAVVGLRARSQWRPRPIGVSVPVSRRR
jgi:hypothetical protein